MLNASLLLNTFIVLRQCYLKLTIKKLLKKFTKIWKKISSLIGKKNDSNSVYYDDHGEYMKTKIEIYENQVNKSFQSKKIPKKKKLYVNVCC